MAGTVDGVFHSDDGGQSWRDASAGLTHRHVRWMACSHDAPSRWTCLYRCYCRAAWLDPDDPDHLLLGPADGVNRNGRIEETHDGGQTWHFASMGLKVPWQRHMVERFVQVDDELLAVLSNGHLLAALSEKLEWRRILPH